MDRIEAQQLARTELSVIKSAGYAAASEHVDTAALKDVSTPAGKSYEIELSYHWESAEHDGIRVICRVCPKRWFTHQHIEESVTLYCAEHG